MLGCILLLDLSVSGDPGLIVSILGFITFLALAPPAERRHLERPGRRPER